MKRHAFPRAVLLAALAACGGCGWVYRPQPPMCGAYVQDKTDLATAELRRAAADPDGQTRAYAMEAIGQVMPAEVGELLEGALQDGDPRVRFTAAMTLGDIKYRPAMPRLERMAKPQTGEADKRVFCAILYALFRMGDSSRLSVLADMIEDTEPTIRADAAMVMGKIGDPSAIGPLKTVLADETNPTAEYNMTEALAALGDGRYQRLMESHANGLYLDLRLAAIDSIARLQTPGAKEVLQGLLGPINSPRVQVSAAGALAALGEYSGKGYDLCIKSCQDPRAMMEKGTGGDPIATGAELTSLQQLAARSLGLMKRPEAIPTLQELLRNPDPAVRMMAAMSIMRLVTRSKDSHLGWRNPPPGGSVTVRPVNSRL